MIKFDNTACCSFTEIYHSQRKTIVSQNIFLILKGIQFIRICNVASDISIQAYINLIREGWLGGYLLVMTDIPKLTDYET